MAEVKYEAPKALIDKAYTVIAAARESGKVRKGSNETTKAIERKQAKLVAIAEDVSPPEIVAHLAHLCNEKDIPYVFVPQRDELGKAAGLFVPTTSVAVTEAGSAKKDLIDVATQIKDIRSGKKPKAEGKKEEKPAKEEKKEAKKEEKAEKSEEKPVKEEKKEAKAEQKSAEAPAEEAKPEEPAKETKEEAPKGEAKSEEAPAAEEKAEEAPAEESKEEAPKEEAKAE